MNLENFGRLQKLVDQLFHKSATIEITCLTINSSVLVRILRTTTCQAGQQPLYHQHQHQHQQCHNANAISFIINTNGNNGAIGCHEKMTATTKISNNIMGTPTRSSTTAANHWASKCAHQTHQTHQRQKLKLKNIASRTSLLKEKPSNRCWKKIA